MKKRQLKHIQETFKKQKVYNQLNATCGQHKLVLVLDNLKPDFNIGKLFRTSEVFSIHEVHLVGTPYFYTSPALGTFKKLKCYFHDNILNCLKELQERNYSLFALDSKATTYLHSEKLPKLTAFILGHEEFGLSFNPLEVEGLKTTKIKQFGQTESLNVSVAGSVAIYEYMRQVVLEN